MIDFAKVYIRKAVMQDADFLLSIKNDETIRKFSIVSKEKIERKNHIVWLKNTLADKDRALYVISIGQKDIGDVRFDRHGEEVEVSIRIHSEYRGAGIGEYVLKNTLCKCKKRHFYTAKIVEGNIRSMNIFIKLGFKFSYYLNGVYYLELKG